VLAGDIFNHFNRCFTLGSAVGQTHTGIDTSTLRFSISAWPR
jgi:hypothetical protein